ncbi:MAG: hypothetical protein IKX23_03225 [Treponema sp.]|nr:hypothetical protein [Treponema sp.]
MKKISSILALTLIISVAASALGVDEPEIKSIGNQAIEFNNYSGPHKRIDSAQSITKIGSDLGAKITPSQAANVGNRNKYYVVHAVDPNEKGKLDADILYIGRDATVDHINNIRRIIAGYLMSAYNYSQKDAQTLAVFITVYNAVYRGKIDVFNSKYKSVVTKNLSSANCGLSVNYYDWPGKTEIVIPLYDVNNGGLSTVDTSTITDSKVVEKMKDDDDRNVDSRKDMVDLKERESDEAAEKAQDAKKDAVEKQKEADQAKKEAEEAKKKADENPDDKKAQQEAEDAKKKADEKQKEADDANKKAEEEQKFADKKQKEAQDERKEIAKDQDAVQKKIEEESKMPSDYGIIISDEPQQLSRLVKFNVDTGDIIKNSPVTVIRNRTIYHAPSQAFMAVAGVNSANGAIKLVLIDQDKMEIFRESNETLAADSVLVRDGSDYYCVIDDNGKWVVAKYDETLTLKLKSPVSVMSSTPICIADTGIVVTSPSGKLILLSKQNLKQISNPNKNNNDANAK